MPAQPPSSFLPSSPGKGFYRPVILAVILVPLFFLPYHPQPEFEAAKTWLVQILALLGLGLWIQSDSVYSSRTYLFIFIFLALCSGSILVAQNPFLALSRLGFLAGVLAFFFLGIGLESGQVQALLKWSVFSGVLVSLLGILQAGGIILKPRPDIYGELMYPSTFRHSNVAAQFISPLLPVTAGLIFATRRRIDLILLPPAFLILGLYLQVANSRAGNLSALLGIAFLLLAWFYFQLKGTGRRLHSSWLKPALLIGSLLIVLSLGFSLSHPVRKSLVRLPSLADFKHPANQVRLLLFRDTLKMIKTHPLLGVGPGNYPAALPDFWSPELRDLISSGTSRTAENAHNDYLTIAAESGLPALLAFLVLVAFSLFPALAGLWKKPDPYRISALGGLAVLICYAAFDYPLQNAASALTFWLLLGIVAARPGSRKISPVRRIPLLSSRPRLYQTIIFSLVILLSAAATRSLLANYYWQRGVSEYVRSPLSAEKSLSRAKLLSPHNHQVLFLLGNIALLQRNLPEAVRYYQSALKLFPADSKARMNLAELYLEQARFPEAEAEIRTVLQLDPQNPGANYRWAVFLGLKGRPSESADYLNRAIRSDPRFQEMARQEPVFLRLKGLPEFRNILDLR